MNGYLVKHPDANAEYVFDFTNEIPENDTLDDYTLTIVDSDGFDRSDDVRLSATINTSDITVIFTGGIDGQNYTVTVIITLGTSETTPTKMIELRVRSAEV